MVLGLIFHDQQAAIFQENINLLLGVFMFERKLALCTKGKGGDCSMFFQILFPITMPCHSFGTIMVKIEQAGIENLSGFSFHDFL